ncbi:MAG: DUF222 domain-containing protein [Actinomycetota bacterium]|nr:DUF222 domain-containing protein [Actinomycetota bacterium]
MSTTALWTDTDGMTPRIDVSASRAAHAMSEPVTGGGAATRPGATTGAEPEGLRSRLERATSMLAEITTSLEPGTIAGPDALILFRQFGRIERLASGAKTLLAGRIDESGAWRLSGRRGAAECIADEDGVSTGQAQAMIKTGRALDSLPDVADAVRKGELSDVQAQLVANTAKNAPDHQLELLDKAAKGSLPDLKERCRQVDAARSARDHLARARRIHAERHFRSWTDHEGAFCFSGRALPEVGSKLRSVIDAEVARRREAEQCADITLLDPEPQPDGTRLDPEPSERSTYGARCLDALVALVCGEDVADASRPGPPSVVVRVDLEALRRGELQPGEICHAEGAGPLPVPTVQALLSDAMLRLIFMECGRIVAVSTQTRTIPSALRAALVERDPVCVVPGCNVRNGLEIDHVVPFAYGGPTSLENLARLCHWHHYLKTYEGWRLHRVGDDPTETTIEWRFVRAAESYPARGSP